MNIDWGRLGQRAIALPQAIRVRLSQACSLVSREARLWRATSLTQIFNNSSARTTAELGELGERLATKWLQKNGAKVLYRNFRAPDCGEVDVVARSGQTLVFTEVKTRRYEGRHRPADAVDNEKRALIIRGAREWLRLLHNPQVSYRFDIAEVLLRHGEQPEIRIIENAFQTKDRGGLR
jgi:putative endonuclease